jgi:hypothetical protein
LKELYYLLPKILDMKKHCKRMPTFRKRNALIQAEEAYRDIIIIPGANQVEKEQALNLSMASTASLTGLLAHPGDAVSEARKHGEGNKGTI